MSGPVDEADTEPVAATAPSPTPVLEVTPSRVADVAGTRVLRALPRRARRTIGAWCFLDHFQPTGPSDPPSMIGPHPHMGLQTVTWLLDGETLHTDSLGSEQVIRPGQLNLMTRGPRRRARRGRAPLGTRGPRRAALGRAAGGDAPRGCGVRASARAPARRAGLGGGDRPRRRARRRAVTRADRQPVGRRGSRLRRCDRAPAGPRVRTRARRPHRFAHDRGHPHRSGSARVPRPRSRRARRCAPTRRVACCSSVVSRSARSSCGGTSWRAPATRWRTRTGTGRRTPSGSAPCPATSRGSGRRARSGCPSSRASARRLAPESRFGGEK